MSTLAEIEQAVAKLNADEWERLEILLHEWRRKRAAEAAKPVSLEKFAGVLRLREDPLDWQERVRGEWR